MRSLSRSQNGIAEPRSKTRNVKHRLSVPQSLGKDKGLSEQFISMFFGAQIEANKLIQYSLLAEWRRRGRAPEHKPIYLGDIRQELNQLQEQLIQALADTRPAREPATCRADVAKAVGRYIARRPRYSPARAIALDRALATFCTPE